MVLSRFKGETWVVNLLVTSEGYDPTKTHVKKGLCDLGSTDLQNSDTRPAMADSLSEYGPFPTPLTDAVRSALIEA
eukprot:2460352-Pleurochrysis_carterae.AAC.1